VGLGYTGNVRETRLQGAQRFVAVIIVLALAGITFLGFKAYFADTLSAGGLLSQVGFWRAPRASVAIISGHAGNDSGAVCEDDEGNATLTEAAVNAKVAGLAASRLRRSGLLVEILEEFDPRLDGLRADVLLSLHADSCIDASGYKAASFEYSATDDADARLLGCIDLYYAEVTGLPHHPNTVTHDMTRYHAFGKIAPTTPAAILELGFLGGDGGLLSNYPNIAAEGVAKSIICFVEGGGVLADGEASAP
jgi:N-acetylmuramoyl-L-alanine amidase